MKLTVYSLFKITLNCNKYITVVFRITLILNSKCWFKYSFLVL